MVRSTEVRKVDVRRVLVPTNFSDTSEAADAHAHAVWLPPGAWSPEAEQEAEAQNLQLVKDRCIIDEHSHLMGALGEPTAGHPHKLGIHAHRR